MSPIKHYLGCECVVELNGKKEIWKFIGYRIDKDDVIIGKGVNIIRVALHEFKLLLRPLSSITDDEARELCKIVNKEAYGDYRYAKWEVEVDPKNKKDIWDAIWLRNKNSDYVFMIDRIDGRVVCSEAGDQEPNADLTYFQWYYEKGFDIPTYPSCKTMKELGLATYENL